MKKTVYFYLVALLSTGCQDEVIYTLNKPESAAILPASTPGPAGAAYALQVEQRCFLLDNSGKFWQYEPTNRSFTAKASPAIPTFSQGGFSAVDLFSFAVDGKAYIGGQSIVAIPGLSQGFPTFFYVYDPDANSWKSATPCPGNGQVPDLGRISFFANGRGYVCFFTDQLANGSSTTLASCYEYTPAKDQWSLLFNRPVQLPPTLAFGKPSQAAVLNGKGYFIANAILKSKVGQSVTGADTFACIFELDTKTNQLNLKLTTNSLGTDASIFFRVGLSAVDKLWFINDGTFYSNKVVANQLFSYDPLTNQLIRTSASLLIEPTKSLSQFIGFSLDKRLYIGMGEYGKIDGTPGGSVSGFAQFDL